ncbi:MAG: hypothetical protein FWF12_00330 [Betaproteobacteria bacterium]|nr:hypothetical protein [Betaproteobacteria bacterium]
MNRPNARVCEAKIPAAIEPYRFNQVKSNVKQYREQEDITAWLKDQDDAEIDFLTCELSNKGNREYRRSLNYR